MSATVISVECGWANSLEVYPEKDGTARVFLPQNQKQVTLDHWSIRDLELASEYSEHCQDYVIAERRFYRVLYQRNCIKPNYPMPAIRLQVEIQHDRVILWRKSQPYWEFQYLASTIPTKLLNRWAE